MPRACPECSNEDTLVAVGPGVERIADEVRALFPAAKTAIVTSDTIWSPAKAAEFVHRMEAGDIDIVVGTQLVTKGYHFPNLTLVGVIDADLGLDGGDLRASERTFQQIMQVAGAPGAARSRGIVYIQTHSPDAQVMRALVTRRRRRLLRRRDRIAPRGRCPAVRPLRRHRRVERGPGSSAGDRDADRPHRAEAGGDGGVRPRPRAAGDAARAAPVPACWSMRDARSTCRT